MWLRNLRKIPWLERESIAMPIPNNVPSIVGFARSIITSASLLQRAVRPSTCKSEFAYLTDREDRFCRKGVGIPRCTVPHTVRRRPFNFFSLLFQTGNENTVSRWRGTCVCAHLGGYAFRNWMVIAKKKNMIDKFLRWEQKKIALLLYENCNK